MPKEGDNTDGHFLGTEDYSIDDYIMYMKDMLSYSLKDNKYSTMPAQEIEKFLKNIAGYLNVIKKKAENLNVDLNEKKNNLENKEIQENFLKKR